MDTAGLHQLRFYPRNAPEEITPGYLDETTRQLFGLPLSNFTKLENVTVNKRKYRQGYSYENKIILLCGDYTKRRPLSIEINGGAFDHACVNVDKISRIIETGYIVSALHAKIDTTETKFSQLFKAYQLDSVTAACLLRSDRQSTSKTIMFGKDPQYTIYEAGKYHSALGNKNLVRHELRLTGDQARQFFSLWREDPDNLATLIKSLIAGQFKVQFLDYTSTDSNRSRRAKLPIWERWLASAAPRRFDRVQPLPARIDNQLKTWTTKLLQLRIELGEETYKRILNRVDNQFSEEATPQIETQLELF